MKNIALAIALAAALTTMSFAKTTAQDQPTTTTKTKKVKKAKKPSTKHAKKDAGTSQSK